MTAGGTRSAGVIGAGFGGLALAIRLQAAGVATTLFEARDKPGGRAYVYHDAGFTFDAGPTVITDPDCLRKLWRLTGHDIDRDVTLLPVDPFYRLCWEDGTVFDYADDQDAIERQIAAICRKVARRAAEGDEALVRVVATAFDEASRLHPLEQRGQRPVVQAELGGEVADGAALVLPQDDQHEVLRVGDAELGEDRAVGRGHGP